MIIGKGFFKLQNLIMLRKKIIATQELGFCDFWRIANNILRKGKSAIPLLYNGPRMSSGSVKAKLFVEIFSRNSNLDD